MRTGFPVMKTGFSLWELTYRVWVCSVYLSTEESFEKLFSQQIVPLVSILNKSSQYCAESGNFQSRLINISVNIYWSNAVVWCYDTKWLSLSTIIFFEGRLNGTVQFFSRFELVAPSVDRKIFHCFFSISKDMLWH